MPAPPHIVIFNPDQWRGDVLGHMDNRAAVTPVLDALAAGDAVSFRNAFCQNPVCTPSRCSFMTGWYPHVRGHRTMHHMLRAGEPCLLRNLKDAGYFVWWGGKNDLVSARDGYDEYCNVKFRPPQPPPFTPRRDLHTWDEWRGDPAGDTYFSFFHGRLSKGQDEIYYDGDWANVLGAVDLINRAPLDRPLCIYLPLGYPHPPYAVEDPWFSRIERDNLPPRKQAPNWSDKPSLLRGIHDAQNLKGWSESRWTELRATYYGMCARVDHQLGLVLEALRSRGIYDETALFMFSDHGDFTGDYGLVEKTQNTFEDCLTRVPFVVKPPKRVPVKPRVSDALVELVDFPATVEEMAGITPGHTHFGRSLMPVLTGATDEHRDAVFCEGGRLRGEEHCKEDVYGHGEALSRFLYYPRIKLQHAETPPGEPLPHTKAVMCRTKDMKYVMRLYEQDELYDLRQDPDESRNWINEKSVVKKLNSLRERTAKFFLETGDVVPHDLDRRG